MEANLSSVTISSAASRATSVPPRPIATPTWACRSAGASLTPSPVTATTCPRRVRARTICELLLRLHPREDARAAPARRRRPRRARRPAEAAPGDHGRLRVGESRSRAIARAVTGWSPVIMSTVTPARRQEAMLSRASVRTGSSMPTSPRSRARSGRPRRARPARGRGGRLPGSSRWPPRGARCPATASTRSSAAASAWAVRPRTSRRPRPRWSPSGRTSGAVARSPP